MLKIARPIAGTFNSVTTNCNKLSQAAQMSRIESAFAERGSELKASLNALAAQNKALTILTEGSTIVPLSSEFKDMQDLLNYAKQRCIQALNSPKPYEHSVVINPKTKKVIAEYKGDENSVAESFWGSLKRGKKNYVIVHGHPTQKSLASSTLTTPLSFTDFQSFNAVATEKNITAINARGEISSLSKTKKFKQLSKETINKLELELNNRVLQSGTPSQNQELKLIAKRLKENPNDKESALKRAEELYEEIYVSENGVKAVNKFWTDISKGLGLKYKTNYTGL